MTDEIAGFVSRLPERYRYSVVSALRQTCEAGVRYGYMTRNPAKLAGKNPQPAPRGVRVFTPTSWERSRTSSARDAAAVEFAAATGLRPSEWASIERQRHRQGSPRRAASAARRRSGRAATFR